MIVHAPDYYLVIARYNFHKAQYVIHVSQTKAEAKEAAEELFPPKGASYGAAAAEPLPHFASAFDTTVLRAVDPETAPPRAIPSAIMEPGLQATLAGAVGTPLPGAAGGETDPGIGWVAVVRPNEYNAFFAKLSGPLHEMYDVEVIPLRGTAPNDVYWLMSPLHWS